MNFETESKIARALFWVIISIAIIIGVSPFPGCMVDEKKAVEALEKAGYSEIVITDRSNYFVEWRGGSANDSVRFTCKAKNSAGKEVSGVYVFSGWLFKSTTIRFQ